MKNKIYIVAAMAALFTASCGDFKTAENGLRYRVLEKGDGEANTDTASMLFANYSLSIASNDSVLRETFTQDQPNYIPVFEPSMKLAFKELVKGDSAEILINADTFFLNSFGQPRPDWIKAGDDIRFIVKVKDIMNQQEMRKKEMEEVQKMSAKDSVDQREAIAMLPQPQKTANGVYYTEIKSGSNKMAKKGDKVKVLYKGMLLNGQVFDENQQAGIEVNVGLQQVIAGWDELLQVMKEGQKIKAIIPW
jgi:FKBP-type peptidyl-prolyl cis-trans isomerase FkpA